MPLDLLEFSRGGGCGCKIDPLKLNDILSELESGKSAETIVDFAQKDDAAVYELDEQNCLIHTLDFFLPLVSDPYDFGRIAACNAISDIYAMGGKPLMALSILGWPTEKIDLNEAKRVLKGAEDICKEAGIHIAGGHSIETSEPLFGLSVNGIAAKKNIKKNNTAKPGDLIYLSKPIGLGLLSNALKQKALSTDGYNTLIQLACRLNTEGILLGQMESVTAVTDVTGFGLLGHLSEMLGEGMGAILNRSKLPVLDEAREIAAKFMYPNITTSNYNFIKERVDGLEGLEFLWLCDPQTSGGLMFTSSTEVQVSNSVCIGQITETGRIQIQS